MSRKSCKTKAKKTKNPPWPRRQRVDYEDENDLFIRYIQENFKFSSSTRCIERVVDGVSVTTNSKTDQEMDEEFLTQYNIFKNNDDMTQDNVEKKDAHYDDMMSIQGKTIYCGICSQSI